MLRIFNSHHPARHAKSFKYAFQGLFHALLNEANFRIQVAYSVLVVVIGFSLQISPIEWGLLILSLGFLLSAEMVNTVVEELIDHLIKEYHEGARIIKDVSAGFVLTAAFTTLAISLLIFAPKIMALL